MPEVQSTMIEVCVFRFQMDQTEYLLLKRREDEKIYPGIWQYVTGSLEGKETAVEGALRELSEETGFRPSHFWTVPHVNAFYHVPNDCIYVVPLFAAQVESGLTPRLSAEHTEFGWFTCQDAVQRLVWPGQKEGLIIVQERMVSGEKPSQLLKIF